MALSAVLAVIDTIWTLVERVDFINQLSAGSASSTITLTDLTHVVRGENARFFTVVTLADIETTHERFYFTWLPSVLAANNQSAITADDIKSEGRLSLIFASLIQHADELSRQLNQLKAVYQIYNADLHVDELTRGFHATIHGYGLLIHIHAVYAELRRIQVGATTLGDARLLPDTLLVRNYLREATAAFQWFREKIEPKRLALISGISSVWPGIGSVLYYYNDGYTALPATTADITLAIPSPPPAHPEDRNRALVEEWHRQRVTGVRDRAHLVVVETYWTITDHTDRLNRAMETREWRQTHYSRFDPFVVPSSTEEFLALSERLQTQLKEKDEGERKEVGEDTGASGQVPPRSAAQRG